MKKPVLKNKWSFKIKMHSYNSWFKPSGFNSIETLKYLIITDPPRSMVDPAVFTFVNGDIGRLSPTAEVPYVASVALLTFLHESVAV